MTATAMACPHCSLGRISDETQRCLLCGRTTAEGANRPDTPSVGFDAYYQIERTLREGARSTLYLARASDTGQQVALKVARLPSDLEAGDLDRFHQEASRAVALDHPHIAALLRFGTADGRAWLATEYIEGQSLAERLVTAGPMPVAEALNVAHQIAVAMEYAHRQRVTHGDLKPTRIVLERGTWVRVAGFGAGEVLTTPQPGAEVPPKVSDQRALARLVHACLTGTPSIAGALPALRDVRPQIVEALRRAEDARPAYRYAGPLEFVAAMRENEVIRPARPSPAPRPSPPPRGPVLETEEEEWEPPRSRFGLAAAASVAVLVAIGVLAWAGLGGGGRSDVAITAPTPTAPSRRAAPVARPLAPPPADVEPETSAESEPPTAPQRARPSPPRPVPQRVVQPAPRPALLTGYVVINSTPWAELYVDGRLIGNTPQLGIRLAAGPHRLRLVQDGYRPLDVGIVVRPNDTLRMTRLVLEEVRP